MLDWPRLTSNAPYAPANKADEGMEVGVKGKSQISWGSLFYIVSQLNRFIQLHNQGQDLASLAMLLSVYVDMANFYRLRKQLLSKPSFYHVFAYCYRSMWLRPPVLTFKNEQAIVLNLQAVIWILN